MGVVESLVPMRIVWRRTTVLPFWMSPCDAVMDQTAPRVPALPSKSPDLPDARDLLNG